MKSPLSDNHNKPATAALEALMSTSVSFPVRMKSGSRGITLQESLQASHLVDMKDLFDAVGSENEMAFPSITWDPSDEEEVQENNDPLGPNNAGFAIPLRRQSLGYCYRTNNLRALARSKTLRTSISSLGGPATTHHPIPRHV